MMLENIMYTVAIPVTYSGISVDGGMNHGDINMEVA